MLIDSTQFPKVWIRFKVGDINTTTSPFQEFEALLARKDAFVLINDEGLEQSEHEHSHDERKQTTLWMKRNKAALKAFVKAAIYIEPNRGKRLAAKAFATVYDKFWGYPMLVVSDKSEALELAQKLLRGARMDQRSV